MAAGAGRADAAFPDQHATGEGGNAKQEQSGLAAAGGLVKNLPAMVKAWVKGLPAWFRTAVLEEEDIK